MYQTELYHHGIKGQKWGIRRYQNPDGTLTDEGKRRLRAYQEKEQYRVSTEHEKFVNKHVKSMSADMKRRGTFNEETPKQLRDFLEKGSLTYKIETEAIKNMTFDDMKAEQIETGNAFVYQLLSAKPVKMSDLKTDYRRTDNFYKQEVKRLKDKGLSNDDIEDLLSKYRGVSRYGFDDNYLKFLR